MLSNIPTIKSIAKHVLVTFDNFSVQLCNRMQLRPDSGPIIIVLTHKGLGIAETIHGPLWWPWLKCSSLTQSRDRRRDNLYFHAFIIINHRMPGSMPSSLIWMTLAWPGLWENSRALRRWGRARPSGAGRAPVLCSLPTRAWCPAGALSGDCPTARTWW